MSDEIEAAGTAIEGGLFARAVAGDDGAIEDAAGAREGGCLNCGTAVTGNYCPNCGQKRHVRRSIGALWHDIVHSVLHFEGKFWTTLPLLAWRPGRLTRRYIRGERAKFVSPMAIFLFSVFLMFAVFSFAGTPFSNVSEASREKGATGFTEAIDIESAELEEQIQEAEAKLAAGGLDAAEVERLQGEIWNKKRGRNAMARITMDELPYPDAESESGPPGAASGSDQSEMLKMDGSINTGWPWFDKTLTSGLQKANQNPTLLLYKLQSNGYKFAWLLIPISMPFVWLTMIGRRGYRFYDHAVFATYSISFMSLLFIFCALSNVIGAPDWTWSLFLSLYPPFHMYRQLRGAYQLGRVEALVRLILLLVSTVICLTLFFGILLALGVLG